MVTDTSSVDVTLGMPMTRLASGNFVQATDANLALSKSGMVDGIAVTVASAGQQFVAQTAGLIDAINVPSLGASSTVDFLINVNGVLARSLTFTAGCLGVAAKDGSAAIVLGAGLVGGGGGGGGGTTGIMAAICTTTGALGDVVTVDAADPTKVRLATDAALLAGLDGYGILLSPAIVPNFPVLYAATDGVAPNSATGLGVGEATWVVVVANRPVRKRDPEPSDYIIGTSHTTGAVHVRKDARLTGEIVAGSRGYECDLTGNVDCSAALQKMIDDSINIALPPGYNARTCYLPRGRYKLSKPLHIKYSGMSIRGDSMGGALLDASQMSSAAIVCSHNLDPMSGPNDNPFAGGTGSTVHLQTFVDESDEYIELSEFGMGVAVDGLPAFTLEMMVWIDPAQHVQGVLLGSGGKRFPSDPGVGGAASAFFFSFDGDSLGCSSHVTVATTGAVTGNFAPSGAWTGFQRGRYVWVEMNVSGGVLRTFIDGWKMPNLTAVGNLVQQDWECVQLGVGISNYFGTGIASATANCNVAYMRISKIARNTFDASPNYTQVYTPPTTAAPPLDGNTLWRSDFQGMYGIFIPALAITSKFNPGGPENSWSQHWFPTTNRVANNDMQFVSIRNLSILSATGVGIELSTVHDSVIENINVASSKTALFCRNTCFNLWLKHIYGTGASLTTSRAGINFGESAYKATWEEVHLDGFNYGIIALASIGGVGGYIIKSRQFGILVIDGSSVNIDNVSLSDEGGGFLSPFNGFGFIRCGPVCISGSDCIIITGSGVCVKAENGQQFFQRCDITIPGTAFGWHDAYTSPVAPANYCFDIRVTDGTSHMGVHAPTFESALSNIGVFPGPEMLIVHPSSSTNVEWNIMPRSIFKHVAIAMADANQTVTMDQSLSGNFDCTGALTANRNLNFPINPSGIRWVFNGTTGGGSHDIIVKTTGGAVTTNVTPGATMGFRSDGAEMRHIT